MTWHILLHFSSLTSFGENEKTLKQFSSERRLKIISPSQLKFSLYKMCRACLAANSALLKQTLPPRRELHTVRFISEGAKQTVRATLPEGDVCFRRLIPGHLTSGHPLLIHCLQCPQSTWSHCMKQKYLYWIINFSHSFVFVFIYKRQGIRFDDSEERKGKRREEKGGVGKREKRGKREPGA